MKRTLTLLLLFIISTASAQLPPADTTGEIRICFDHNVEFAGFVFFLGTMAVEAGEPGAKMPSGVLKKDWFRYHLRLADRYRAYLNDPDLAIAAGYMERLQATDIFPLLMSVSRFPQAVLSSAIDLDKLAGFGRDSLTAVKEASRFLAAMNRFYKTVSFDDYFQSSGIYYRKAMQEIRSALPIPGSVAMMERFYGRRFTSYTLLPSLTIPSGMAFGVNTINKGNIAVFNLFGPFAVPRLDSTVSLGFDQPQHMLELSIHEFGHSFANTLIAQLPDSIVRSKGAMFEPIREAMDNQGYQTWKSCLTEHFIRAGEVIVLRRMGKTKPADDLLRNYTGQRKFIYLPQIIAAMEVNMADGKTYKESLQETLLELGQ